MSEPSQLEQQWYAEAEEVRTQCESVGAGEPPPRGNDCSEDSESSSESSSEASSVGDALLAEPGFAAEVHENPWQPDSQFAVRKRTKTVHLIPRGSSCDAFVCGRKFSDDYVRADRAVFAESRTCKQCLSSKPLRDIGSLTSALDSLRSREP